MQVEKMDAYLKLGPILDRSSNHIKDYEELALKEIDPRGVDLYLFCARILRDWVNYIMVSYAFRGLEGFLLVYREVDSQDVTNVLLVSIKGVEKEPDFKDTPLLYLIIFFNRVTERFGEAKNSKEYQAIIKELKMID